MSLDLLKEKVASVARELSQHLEQGNSVPNLALRRSARLPLVAALYPALNRPLLLLTDRTDRALTLADELSLLAPHANRLYYPEPNPLFYENAPWGVNTRRDRLMALTTLAAYHIPGASSPERPPLIVAPARAIMTRTLPRREFLKAVRNLKIGQVIQLEELARSLVSLGYEPVNTVISAGQFARRGGILDLWPPAELKPVRLEFFGDEIDTLRQFDPATQRTIQRPAGESAPTRVLISPAREYLLNKSLESIPVLAGIPTPGEEQQVNEFYLPYLHPSPSSLLDYLPRNALVIIDNVQDFHEMVQDFEEQAVGLRADSIAEGNLPEDFPVPYLSDVEIQDALSTLQTLELGPASAEEVSTLATYFLPGQRFGGRLKPLMDHLSERASRQEVSLIVSRQAARLHELWQEQAPRGEVQPPTFLEGSLTEGWILTPPDEKPYHLLTDGEIFGWRRPEPRQRHRAQATAPEAAYADLKVGDWVVHVDHGIGRFLGLVNRTVEGIEREYLSVEYAEGDMLYVPVHQADRLTAYIGPDSREPSPTRLGGSEWKAAKTRVQEAVEAVAEDLLELYAERQIVKGHAFSPDTHWQNELEGSFPYIETEDQLRVLREVKKDMESTRPMDRLICGDVGFGKTEVALRAAFKAVMDGRQVAILVPTTVLAQQHYITFRDRLSTFPVEVEMLSRFRNPQQQREIIFRLAKGAVDIIIGTHRLLQGDIEFKDLGLLIIDEEQRFGVTHKEYLKKMRTEVDVLTLTATPIPRTLYMALTGVRDISTINTPPEERLPIITHVGPYSKRIVRQAILREVERGGQIFFVHNRVQTIYAMKSHLEQLVPEARIAVAHGQMPENELAERMQQFTAGNVDVLLSTSIIESGLDIPNANTLIVDRADTFGLAQLYQLRGRVGRGAQRAYAYFFKHGKKQPTLEGRQRLETLAENTQLGAGFSIAMRDLEIRGTGDFLGTRQHGHIATVGFHLYTRMLAEAVSNLRAKRGLPHESPLAGVDPTRPLVSVDLPLHVSLPASYVPDKNMRLRLYRRIANLLTLDEVNTIADEFSERFGPPPEEVRNLLFQLKVKLLAEKAGISSVSVEGDQLVLRFRVGAPPNGLHDLEPSVRVGKTALWMPFHIEDEWRARLIKTIIDLQKYNPNGQSQ